MYHVGANDTGKKMNTWESKLGLLGRSLTDQDVHDSVI